MSQVQQALDALDVALTDVGARIVRNLAPGLSRDAIRKAFAELPLEPSGSVLELYSWHDGVRLDGEGGYEEWEIAPSIYFPPLDYAVGTYHRLRDAIGKIDPLPGSTRDDYWRASWFPILRTQGPEHLVVSCGEPDDGTVWFVSWEEPSLWAFTGLADLADRLRMRITSGAYRGDPSGRFDIAIDLLQRNEERPLPHVW